MPFYAMRSLPWRVCRGETKGYQLDCGGGYVFDRFYFEGQSFRDSRFNRIDVGDGPFVTCRGGYAGEPDVPDRQI
jgi:hypothetical protein